jgi:very-short-patch-repair endonuclease
MSDKFFLPPTSRARKLRRSATEAEAILWRRLRGNQLGVKFRRQHPIGPFVLDFFCDAESLAVEVDGGQHYDDEQQLADRKRTTELANYGVKALRFRNSEVLARTNDVLDAIVHAVDRSHASIERKPS